MGPATRPPQRGGRCPLRSTTFCGSMHSGHKMWPHTHRPRRQWALAPLRPLLRQADPHPAGARCLHRSRRIGSAGSLGYTCRARSWAWSRHSLPRSSNWQDAPSAARHRPRASGHRRRQVLARPRREPPLWQRSRFRKRWARPSPPAPSLDPLGAPSCPGGSPPQTRDPVTVTVHHHRDRLP